jgi:hypothetical protein
MMQLGIYGGTKWKAQYNDVSVQTTGRGFTVPAGTIVTLTGWYDGNKYYIVEYPGYYISIGEWAQLSSESASPSQAQSEINKLIQNNQIIFENNLLMSRFINAMSISEKNTLYYLQKRLEERDNMLREADVFSQMQEAKIMGYSNYQNYLNNFMSSYSSGVGLVISTTAAIIIGAVVVASLSTAAYFAFKSAYEESVQDVKLSKKLLQTLSKYNISEEDMAIIEQETQGIVTKAVFMEKINTTLGNFKNIIIFGALGYIGYELYNRYKKSKK